MRQNIIRSQKIFVVRHAESVANSLGIYQGQTYDTDLSKLGEKQAQALAKELKDFKVSKIIASPLKRTRRTAEIIAKEIGCQIEFDTRIIETNHGRWEGKSKTLVAQDFPHLYHLWLREPTKVIFPGGEGFFDIYKRTLDFFEKADFSPNSVIITHDNIIRLLIAWVLVRDLNTIWDIDLETTAINTFEVKKTARGNIYRVIELNNIEHLGNLRNNIKVQAL